MSLSKTPNLIGLILFWGWNILSVFFSVFLMGIAVLPFVFMAAINGEIPLSITVCLLILMVIPIYAIYFGIKQPRKAVRFFFGIEIPIVLLTLFRVFIVRELTLASGFLLLSAFIAIGVFAWSLRENESSLKVSPYLKTAATTLVLVAGIYIAILSSLYALPLIIEFIKAFFEFNWLDGLTLGGGILLLMMALFFFGSLAFFVFPVYVAYFYPKLWKQKIRENKFGFSKSKYYLVSACVTAVWFGAFTLLSHQGQADYVSRLKDMNLAEKRVEMENPAKVRKRLLSAYLNEYRYFGTKAQSRNLIPMYKHSTGSESLGKTAQDIQSFLLQPLLYKGGRSDGHLAGKLYTELFDGSIQRDEKKAITKALEATFNRDEAVAGLMNIGARNVILREQNIVVDRRDKYFTVEIEEVYENLTFENQEIFYYFSLPEDAAITGIWIGRTEKREEMDTFIVAPRGAAQKVYEQQVRRNIDPALLEQVGPAQYRLRVFPIPVTRPRAQFSSRRGINRRSRGEKPLMRVHMQYVVPAGGSDHVLPTLLEKRNVDWSHKTTRTLNGTKVRKTLDWMPAIKGDTKAKLNAEAFAVSIDESVMTLSPVSDVPNTSLGRLAVIVDSSYSLKSKETSLQQSIEDLNALQTANLAEFDVYIGSVEKGGMLKATLLDLKDIKPFGSLTARNLLNQFLETAEPANYKAVILLTDQGLYGTEGAFYAADLKAPLYFLHVDKAAAAYDDDVLDLIYRSGGGVATSVQSLRRQLSLNGPNTRVVEDRVWTAVPNKPDVEISTTPEAQALAARQLILMESFGKPPSVETLDELHGLAITHDVVTPYSSMIVLVNDRQKEALKKESEAEDRFEREGRSGEEALSSPANPLVSGVPEPHEWLLIILSILMLYILWRKREEWDVATFG